MGDTDRESVIEIDAEPFTWAVIRELRVGRLNPEQKAILERAIARYVELRLSAVGASERQLTNIRIEQQALRASLASLGEALAAQVWDGIRQAVRKAIRLAVEVVL